MEEITITIKKYCVIEQMKKLRGSIQFAQRFSLYTWKKQIFTQNG